jgi:hypothetical protein
VDVFDMFTTHHKRGVDAPEHAAGHSPDQPADRPAEHPREHSSRGRTIALASGAAVVALLAVVGGAVAVARILLPDEPTACTATDVSNQEQVTAWLQEVVRTAAPDDPTRQVSPLGCEAAGSGVGAHTALVDDVELGEMTAVLESMGCTIAADLPAHCDAVAGEVPVLVEVTAQQDAPDGDYDMAVTVRDGAAA